MLVYRIPDGLSLSGRSVCDNCGQQIRIQDNIPILGWLIRRGRCYYCGNRISRTYLLVEILATPVFYILAVRSSNLLEALSTLVFAVLGTALIIIDIRHHRLPDALTFPLFLILTGLTILKSLLNDEMDTIKRALILSFVAFVFLLTLRFASRGGMGLGDVKLAPSIAMVTASQSLEATLWAFSIAFISAGVASIVLIFFRKATRKSWIPFGPFLILGGLMIVATG